MRVLLIIGCLLFASPAFGVELWTGILDPARATNWQTVGMTGGPPTTRTQCVNASCVAVTNAGSSATFTQINTAITNAPANTYVKLGPGTFALTDSITITRNDVTLRGSGPDQTFIVPTNRSACTGAAYGAIICVRGPDISYYGPNEGAGLSFSTTWTATSYAQGQTQATFASGANLTVGRWLFLDQTDDASCPAGVEMCVCVVKTTCTDEGGGGYGRTGRQQFQWVQVVSCSPACGTAGATLVTFTPGLLAPNWSAAKSPGAWWGSVTGLSHGVCIEDMSMDATNAAGAFTNGAAHITFIFTYDYCATNLRLIYAPNPRAYIMQAWAHHGTIQSNYFFGSLSEGTGPLHYGVDGTHTQSLLVVNNICQRRTSCWVANGDVASVWAYNFAINDQYSISPTFMQASNYNHEAGSFFLLHEGNQGAGIKGDIVHGTSNVATFFRNYAIGWETGKAVETGAAVLYAYNRFWNFIGNVLGEDTYHTSYSSTTTSIQQIYALGVPGNLIASDAQVANTVMRWGNYDTVNDATRFVNGEVPSGIAKYSNPIPASQTLPSSFYITSKPSFFGSNPWPPIGPDVTGTTGPGNHVYRIPARVCWEDVMGGSFSDTTPRTFNANLCYGATDTAPPLAPTNLRFAINPFLHYMRD